MSTLHPTAMIGLIAAATPVVIYLLLRRRKTEVHWGAGYLLRMALASRKKSSLWRQYVVLAVRTLILALATVLIAQAFLPGEHQSSLVPELPDRAVHRVVLLDNSRSMTVNEGDSSRIDRARSAANALLRSQRQGDTLDLISLVPKPGSSLEPITMDGKIDENRSLHTLAAIAIRDGEISLEPALAAAMKSLARTPGDAGEIYLLSDFPRELEKQVAAVQWFAPLAQQRGVRLAPVNMIGPQGDTPQKNVSIDSITLGTDLLVAGIPTRLYVDAVNNSDLETTAVFDVSLDEPGKSPGQAVAFKQQSVRLNPDEHKRIGIPISLPAGNAQVLTVSARPSRLASQSTRSLSVDVKDALDVWLVADEKDPTADTDDEPGDADFFLRALKERKTQSSGVKLRNARINDLTLAIPANVDAIIIAGPLYTNPAMAKPLTDFVRRGGGLIITASNRLHLPAFNESLGALLPALLDQPSRETIDPEVFLTTQVETSAAVNGVDSPLFEEFSAQNSGPASDLPQARFYNYYRLINSQAVTGVMMRLSNGEPLLLEKQVGRGRVCFFASTLGVGWTSLPVRQCYIPLISRMLSRATAGRTLPLNLQPGGTFITPWPAKGEAMLTLPDQSTHAVSVLDTAAGQFIVLDGLRDGGLYQVNDAAGHRAAFTIAGGAVESDLRTLAETAKTKLSAALGAEIYPNWASAVAALGPERATRPLWPWLLAAMLALYLFETWFVRTV